MARQVTPLPFRDKILRDPEPACEERANLFRDLDVGEMTLPGQDVQGSAADPLGQVLGAGDGHGGVFAAAAAHVYRDHPPSMRDPADLA
jgi:hypothetical protein